MSEFQVSNFRVFTPKCEDLLYFSTLLKGKMILINKKGRNYQKDVPLSMICGIKWKNLRRIILSHKLGEDKGAVSSAFTGRCNQWCNSRTRPKLLSKSLMCTCLDFSRCLLWFTSIWRRTGFINSRLWHIRTCRYRVATYWYKFIGTWLVVDIEYYFIH